MNDFSVVISGLRPFGCPQTFNDFLLSVVFAFFVGRLSKTFNDDLYSVSTTIPSEVIHQPTESVVYGSDLGWLISIPVDLCGEFPVEDLLVLGCPFVAFFVLLKQFARYPDATVFPNVVTHSSSFG